MRRLLLPVILLSGCATTRLVDIDYSIDPPYDWPKLEERITYGTVSEVREWCQMPHYIKASNCARIFFDTKRCLIYLSDPKDAEALAHERAHCHGYDHVGDINRSKNAWEQWKNSNSR